MYSVCSAGLRPVAGGSLVHALDLLAVCRVSVPAADAVAGQLVQPKMKQPGEQRMFQRRRDEPVVAEGADQPADRGRVGVDQSLIDAVGHDQRRVIEGDLDGQAG
jgi:hypothetical protein